MNNVKLLHINYKVLCFPIFFNGPVALKKKNWPPRKCWNDAPDKYIYLYIIYQYNINNMYQNNPTSISFPSIFIFIFKISY